MSALLNATLKSSAGITLADDTTAPVSFANGLPFDADGALAVDTTTAINHHHQGLPFTANGRLAVVFEAPARYGNGAAPFDEDGRLCLDDDTASQYANGVPYTILSSVQAEATAPPEPVELVRDVEFEDPDNWDYAPEVITIVDSSAVLTASEVNNVIEQVAPDVIADGDMLEVSFEVFDYIRGEVAFFGAGVIGTARTANGIYTQTLEATAAGSPGLIVYAVIDGAILSVRNFSVLRLN